MAVLYKAELHPSKLDLINAWLPGRPWFAGPVGVPVDRLAACRFDDPAGEVGVETMLVRAGDGPIYHTPLTYRGAPLAGAAAFLLGTSEHSTLGTRWIYDAVGDPVYAAVLAAAIVSGGGEAEEYIEDEDGRQQRREPAMTVRGSGVPGAVAARISVVREVVDSDPAVVVTDGAQLHVVRVVGTPVAGATLTATWPGATAVLASL
ncbi:hypothetical protein HDA40_000541 [Hamadaea flava]|uniref:Maltokinase N-terminal cap domain-containing protein n=1 Tax=Hamadaea flava TaxID=1742688 RepID=A0ABV8M133_9ACTN|nr:hypothetical protein [Hamadaea flava]MCP2322034.1 hypothetical protein [Hamadaea flava]